MQRRKLITTLVGALLAVVVTVFPGQSRAAGALDYLAQALSKVVAASALTNLADFDYVGGNSLFGAYLAKGRSQELTKSFDAGTPYLVIAAADDEVRDLDLEVRRSNGTILTEDVDSAPIAIVHFIPSQSGRLKLTLKNYDSRRAGFCAMVILRETDSSGFSLQDMVEALSNSMRLSAAAATFYRHFATSSFCVFGGRLNQRQDSFLYDVSLSPGRYALVAASSNNVSDVDLEVVAQNKRQDPAGVVIASDRQRDKTPVCLFTGERGKYYSLNHKNYRSVAGKSGFVFSCLLKAGGE